jgi:hypothetical protein
MLSLIFIVLAHWNNNPQIDMSIHSDRLSFLNRTASRLLDTKVKVETSDFRRLSYKNKIQISPNRKHKIHDPFKYKIDSSRTIAMIQRGPWSWTNSIIFINIAESRWSQINEQMYFINLRVQSISVVKSLP